MRTLAFLDCPTGISGDMCLGGVVSAGVPLTYLQTSLGRLNLPETVELQAQVLQKNGIAATKVCVMMPHETEAKATSPPVRHLHEIEQIITTAPLPQRAIAWSLAIFRRLAIAEGAIHGIDPQQVHFHEVGATDAIVDIVGTCLGFDWLGVDVLYCGPLPTGSGTVRAAHGRLPVPAPAVLKLMEMAQMPIYNTGLRGELVTPTGAAIATELAHHFGDPPAMTLRKVGLGAGNKDLPIPNILRLWIGSETVDSSQQKAHIHSSHEHPSHEHPSYSPDAQPDHPAFPDASSAPPSSLVTASKRSPSVSGLADTVVMTSKTGSDQKDEREQRQGIEAVTVLETQVDDLSPQAIGYLYDCLLQAGALDVFTQGVMMKKSRPGHLITVITYPEQAQVCEQILLTETTTLGVRYTQHTRLRLRREIRPIETAWGTVRMKVAFEPHSDQPLKAHPEYEDCATLARQHHLPWRVVHDQALCHWQLHHAEAGT
ncbi:MAG: nickel pincer cofactor biosynthesis protein LarC [Leptolyngbya sp. SIO1D8]|nr:nickel pincer cofactor biosynthesis protein LarC [Leptolyngbya sp. SIO1D8]